MPGPEPPPVCIMPRYLELYDSSGTSDNGGASVAAAPPATPQGVPRVTPCNGAIMTSCWELRNEVRARIGEAMVRKTQPRVGVTFTLLAVPFAAHGVFEERGWLKRKARRCSKHDVEVVKLEALDSVNLENFLAFHTSTGVCHGMGRAVRKTRGNSWGALGVCTRLVLTFYMEGRTHDERRTKVKVEYDFSVVTPMRCVKLDTAMINAHKVWALYDSLGLGEEAAIRERVRIDTLEYVGKSVLARYSKMEGMASPDSAPESGDVMMTTGMGGVDGEADAGEDSIYFYIINKRLLNKYLCFAFVAPARDGALRAGSAGADSTRAASGGADDAASPPNSTTDGSGLSRRGAGDGAVCVGAGSTAAAGGAADGAASAAGAVTAGAGSAGADSTRAAAVASGAPPASMRCSAPPPHLQVPPGARVATGPVQAPEVAAPTPSAENQPPPREHLELRCSPGGAGTRSRGEQSSAGLRAVLGAPAAPPGPSRSARRHQARPGARGRRANLVG